MPSRPRRLLRIAVFVAVQLVLVFGLGELAIRVAARHDHSLRMLLYDPRFTGDLGAARTLEELLAGSQLGYRPLTVVSGFRLNSRGFRDEEYSRERPAGSFRAVVLGDSFAFASGGVPHRQHWPQVAEDELSRLIGRPAELVSLGVPGVGLRFQLRLWQLEGSTLSPDLVIVAFCVGNDFNDELGLAVERAATDELAHRSVLFRSVRNLLRLWRSGSHRSDRGGPEGIDGVEQDPATVAVGGVEVDGSTYDPDRPTFSEQEFLAMVSRRMGVCRRVNRERATELAREAERVLAELEREVSLAGSELLVVAIPDEYQIDLDLAQRAMALRGLPIEDCDVEWPQQALADICRRLGIRCLDLLPVFRQEAGSGRLYRLRDTHWNIRGNALAGSEVAQRIAADL